MVVKEIVGNSSERWNCSLSGGIMCRIFSIGYGAQDPSCVLTCLFCGYNAISAKCRVSFCR